MADRQVTPHVPYCTGKVRHLDEATATKHIERMSRGRAHEKRPMKKRRHHPLSAYKCPNCGFWHIGSKGFHAGETQSR